MTYKVYFSLSFPDDHFSEILNNFSKYIDDKNLRDKVKILNAKLEFKGFEEINNKKDEFYLRFISNSSLIVLPSYVKDDCLQLELNLIKKENIVAVKNFANHKQTSWALTRKTTLIGCRPEEIFEHIPFEIDCFGKIQ